MPTYVLVIRNGREIERGYSCAQPLERGDVVHLGQGEVVVIETAEYDWSAGHWNALCRRVDSGLERSSSREWTPFERRREAKTRPEAIVRPLYPP